LAISLLLLVSFLLSSLLSSSVTGYLNLIKGIWELLPCRFSQLG
jgi:hypothetical protein